MNIGLGISIASLREALACIEETIIDDETYNENSDVYDTIRDALRFCIAFKEGSEDDLK